MIVFGVRRVIRFNVLGCLLIVVCIALMGAASQLLGQPDSFYRANGYAILSALVLLFAWPLVAWRMGDSGKAVGDASSGL